MSGCTCPETDLVDGTGHMPGCPCYRPKCDHNKLAVTMESMATERNLVAERFANLQQRLMAAIEAARVFQMASERKGKVLEEIAACAFGEHRAVILARNAIRQRQCNKIYLDGMKTKVCSLPLGHSEDHAEELL